MKKKRIIIISIIMVISIISIITISNKVFKKEENIKVYVDGELATAIPAKSDGKVVDTITCDSGITATFDYTNWKIQIKGITSGRANFKCTINFKTDPNTTFSDYLYNNRTTLGLVDENGLRYEGESPNNWILFNNELWRIIGRLSVKNGSGTTQNLVKLIRAEVLDGLAWNASGNTTWEGSWLQLALNSYYNKTDYSDCHYNSSNTKTCKFSITGLNTTTQNIVEEVYWNVGTSSLSTAATIYTNETNSTWKGKVALMSASDYGYAVLASDCARSNTLYSYNSSTCAAKNWLISNSYEWFLTPTSSSYVFRVYAGGMVYYINPNNVENVRPSVYLKSTVKYKGGDGTHDNPYQIG